ncbi:MAG TPA: acyltransferase, partial [Albitalea sp.]|nr:acyltransferase [Albitalea sp.]
MKEDKRDRLSVLDGWRGVSILLVLACHLLPLGPKPWQLNDTAGPMGMALFFTLSGFLITRFLLQHDSVVDFLIRRFFRIVPLAWAYMLVTLFLYGSDHYASHLLFYVNGVPDQFMPSGGHLWSLCVEMQFYVSVALIVAVLGKRGLYLLPLACLAVTANRIA